MAPENRKAKVSAMIDEVSASAVEMREEWVARGETAALKKLVHLLGLVVTALANVLREVRPRLTPSASHVYESMQGRVVTLNMEVAAINSAMEALLRTEEEA